MRRAVLIWLVVIGAILAKSPIDFQTLEQRFVQRVTNDQNQTLSFSGKVWLKKPNLARYDYEKPQPKIIAIRGNQVLMIEPDLEQATHFKSDLTLNILEVWKMSKEVSKTKREATINDQLIAIEHNGENIVRVYYTDDFDNFIEIVLGDPKRDATIANNFFTPAIPSGYDLISQ
ncbi:hypothetical protein AGMMS49521_3670 [Campylobacterota bacterium]|nr:hypothetical protein AGMMS49521_3670 [Campylobacterota bacterium]